MTYFTKEEFKSKYNLDVQDWQIENACEMIYSQIGNIYKEEWDTTNCPDPIKRASMEQLRFILEYDIPLIDNRGVIKAGQMESDLSTDYSTLALRILANHGYWYRGNRINSNMSMRIPFN